ncbi:MAG: hypothetical protein ACR2PG_25810 [Hyphomicrobiaceae bacterium]
MTKFHTYNEYQVAMADLRTRNNKAIAQDDPETQRSCMIEARRIIAANPQWGIADRAWAGRNQDDDDDFASDSD